MTETNNRELILSIMEQTKSNYHIFDGYIKANMNTPGGIVSLL